MTIDTIMTHMFEWKYIWWTILVSYVLISEVLYWIMCKFDDDKERLGWIHTKLVCFFIGGVVTCVLILFIPISIGSFIYITHNPMNVIKGIGIFLIGG